MLHAELKRLLSQSASNIKEGWRLEEAFVCMYVLI